MYDTVIASNLVTRKSLDVTKDMFVYYIWIHTKERYTPSYYDNMWIGPTELRGLLHFTSLWAHEVFGTYVTSKRLKTV